MSKHVLAVFLYELKRNAKRRGYLFSTFGLPLLAIVIYLGIQAATGGSANPINQLAEFEFDTEETGKSGYVDLSDTFEPPPQDSPVADQLVAFESESAADAAMDAGEIDTYYVIAADYLETGNVTSYIPTFSLSALGASGFENLFYSQFVDQMDLRTLNLLSDPARISATTFEVTDETSIAGDSGNDQTVATIFAVLLALALLGTSGYLMQSIIEEKKSRLVEILISSVPPLQLLTGKIGALGLLGLLQVVVYFVAIVAVSTLADTGFLAGVTFEPILIFMAIVYFLLGYMLFSAAFGGIGALVTSVSESQSFAFVFIFPALLPWVFSTEIADDPGGTLAVVLSMIPLTSPMAMVMRLSSGAVPLIELALSLGILAVSVAGMFWLAGRLFRVNTLLAGQRPKLTEIPGLIFGTNS
jgi:ABC-2 type transport system permease protein